MDILDTEKPTEKSVFEQLKIYPKDFRPFPRTLIVDAFNRGNSASLINFLSRPEHVKALNGLRAFEINHIIASTENLPTQPLISNFEAYETIENPISVAMALMGYELKCLNCDAYHLNHEAIGFQLPIHEINKAQENDADLDHIESLIPDMHCPHCNSINKMQYLFELKF